MSTRAAAVFVNHGAGPLPVLRPVTDPDHGPTRHFMESTVPNLLGLLDAKTRPTAIVVLSAHWEDDGVRISSGTSPYLLYDYYNFPSEAYNITYNAPGAPALAKKIHALLSDAAIASKLDAERGWDHGTFVPMKLIRPAEDIPIVQLSVVAGWDPTLHFKIGQVLSVLRDENVAIVGSGMSFHPNWGTPVTEETEAQARQFTSALTAAVTEPLVAARMAALANWEALPFARVCHQRDEHLIPLHVVAGAGGEGRAQAFDVHKGMYASFAWTADPYNRTHGPTRRFLESNIPELLGLNDLATRPKAIVVVTAHWEENYVAISSGESHRLMYDYYGFPDEAYAITYKAKGSPSIAQKIHQLLGAANVPSQLNPARGWDHGTFVPLKLIRPAEDIPIVQISVVAGLDPALHFKIGQVLSVLRDENIAIVGSGATFHPSRSIVDIKRRARKFNAALTEAALQPDVEERRKALKNWALLPHARDCHQREEHLIPLMVIAGAGGVDTGAAFDVDEGIYTSFAWRC
ncbi:extradiol ring-cleavage dioxygenase III subunit B [Achlya hypogyna]|uniref:Extradiol ring-cleavage dioxygenase III subunit B n=1 Tax=Achlya hypogyna TaxID=1202772 RepID=A0A1V9ZP70_ACHHY|nr:extradiol ring-cleavage dioxygenase III subunit B [Achlya hypogyna]